MSSVRKNLKINLLQLLKHPASVDNLSQVTTLLTDLGATQAEVRVRVCVNFAGLGSSNFYV